MAIRDSRWPFLPFTIIRSLQLLFSIITLALTAYIVAKSWAWPDLKSWSALGLATSLLTLIWVGANFALYFMNMLLPLAVVIVDALLLVLWLISMAGTAADGGVSHSDCIILITDFDYYLSVTNGYISTPCQVSKGVFAIELLTMLLFIVTLVFSSITLHRYRKDLRGNKHAQGLPPTSGAGQVEAGMPMDGMSEAKIAYGQDQQVYEQQPVYQAHDAGMYNPPQQFVQVVSPVGTPAPEQQGGGYSTVSSATAPTVPSATFQH